MLKIEKLQQNGLNGLLEVHARTVVESGNGTTEGALEVHGIDPIFVHRNFGGDVKTWLKTIDAAMQQNHQRRSQVVTGLAELQGKTISFDEEDNTSGS